MNLLFTMLCLLHLILFMSPANTSHCLQSLLVFVCLFFFLFPEAVFCRDTQHNDSIYFKNLSALDHPWPTCSEVLIVVWLHFVSRLLLLGRGEKEQEFHTKRAKAPWSTGVVAHRYGTPGRGAHIPPRRINPRLSGKPAPELCWVSINVKHEWYMTDQAFFCMSTQAKSLAVITCKT